MFKFSHEKIFLYILHDVRFGSYEIPSVFGILVSVLFSNFAISDTQSGIVPSLVQINAIGLNQFYIFK